MNDGVSPSTTHDHGAVARLAATSRSRAARQEVAAADRVTVSSIAIPPSSDHPYWSASSTFTPRKLVGVGAEVVGRESQFASSPGLIQGGPAQTQVGARSSCRLMREA